MTEATAHDVVIVGGGPAGLSAGIFTARASLNTVIFDDGNSILRRNAHLENYPGFPAGVNSRLLLEMMRDHAQRTGCECRNDRVVEVTPTGDSFDIHTASGDVATASYVIAATKNAVDFLEDLDDLEIIKRGKSFVETDDRGRTGVSGLYAAGRLAQQPYQTIIVAGHGASVGRAVIEDSDVAYYHDWVTPDRYFTGRDRDLPPGCEEIDTEERLRREHESMACMQQYFASPHPDEPTQHPSVSEE